MSVAQALREATERLSSTSDTARLDAEVLMAHALGVSRSDMLLRHMQANVPSSFAGLVERRALHEPVAYITGRTEFYGIELAVTPAVLIPRSDSEAVVEAALAVAPDAKRVLDLGTGSGALLLAVLSQRQMAQGIGIDASKPALEVAQANAARVGVSERAQWLQRDWTQPNWTDGLGTFDLILCNPPYVEKAAKLDPDVRNYEPGSALFAGPDGLDDYRIVIPQLRDLMTEDGVAVLEIGATQTGAVTEIAEKVGFVTETRHDLANRPRAVILR